MLPVLVENDLNVRCRAIVDAICRHPYRYSVARPRCAASLTLVPTYCARQPALHTPHTACSCAPMFALDPSLTLSACDTVAVPEYRYPSLLLLHVLYILAYFERRTRESEPFTTCWSRTPRIARHLTLTFCATYIVTSSA